MSEADRRPFVGDAKRAGVADARAAGTSKTPFSQDGDAVARLAFENDDEEDYGESVRRVTPVTSDITQLTIRVNEADIPFYETQRPFGHALAFPDTDDPIAQGDDDWLPYAGEQRFVSANSKTYIFEIGAEYVAVDRTGRGGVVLLDAVGAIVRYKVPDVRYRTRYWGINREMLQPDFIEWLNYNPAPMVSLANFYEGAIAGDAIRDPTVAHLAGQLATSFIPVVDQIADARDTIISLWTVASTRGREGKLMLAANIAAWVPFGDAVGLLPRIAAKLKSGDSVTAIARQTDGTLAALVRRGDDMVAMTDEADTVVSKGVTKAIAKRTEAIEQQVFCGLD